MRTQRFVVPGVASVIEAVERPSAKQLRLEGERRASTQRRCVAAGIGFVALAALAFSLDVGARTTIDETERRMAHAESLQAAITARSADIRRPLAPLPPLQRPKAPALEPASHSAADMICLARAVYFEARGEPIEGQIAVAQVVMNRVRSSGDGICAVVYKGQERAEKCQFSFACHAHRQPSETVPAWTQAQWIAEDVATGRAFLRELDRAEHFHTIHVKPVWRHGLKIVRRIGLHVFYVAPGVSPDMTFARHPSPAWDGTGTSASLDVAPAPVIQSHTSTDVVGAAPAAKPKATVRKVNPAANAVPAAAMFELFAERDAR